MIDVAPSFVIAVFIYCITGNINQALIAYISALLHELSHVFTAYWFGYRLKNISAFACGFRASFKGFDNPPFLHETVIALAGPFTNLLLAAVIGTGVFNYAMTSVAVKINIYMFAINLLPVMPLDGGRTVYAFLKTELPYKKARKHMNVISVSVALLSLVLVGIYTFVSSNNIALLIVSLFILSNITLIGNSNLADESSEVKKLKVYNTLKDCILSDIILKTGINQNILVFVTDEDGNVYGYITGGDIKRAAFENKYSVSALALAREFTNGGNFNGT